jgi:hypothetical protein
MPRLQAQQWMKMCLGYRDYKTAGSSSFSLGTYVLEALASKGMELTWI